MKWLIMAALVPACTLLSQRDGTSAIEFAVSASHVPGHVQLQLSYNDAGGGGLIVSQEPLSTMIGLPPSALSSAEGTPLAFRIDRPAGAFRCEGSASEFVGKGLCNFSPKTAFASLLQEQGLGTADTAQQLTLALHGASAATIAELKRQRAPKPTVQDLIDFSAVHPAAPSME